MAKGAREEAGCCVEAEGGGRRRRDSAHQIVKSYGGSSPAIFCHVDTVAASRPNFFSLFLSFPYHASTSTNQKPRRAPRREPRASLRAAAVCGHGCSKAHPTRQPVHPSRGRGGARVDRLAVAAVTAVAAINFFLPRTVESLLQFWSLLPPWIRCCWAAMGPRLPSLPILPSLPLQPSPLWRL